MGQSISIPCSEAQLKNKWLEVSGISCSATEMEGTCTSTIPCKVVIKHPQRVLGATKSETLTGEAVCS